MKTYFGLLGQKYQKTAIVTQGEITPILFQVLNLEILNFGFSVKKGKILAIK